MDATESLSPPIFVARRMAASAVRALENAPLRSRQRRLGGTWNALEAARDVGRGNAGERRAVVIDVRRAGTRVGVSLRDGGAILTRCRLRRRRGLCDGIGGGKQQPRC